jgi:alpha-beta hydrolase superfamily lysophospholipase
VRTLGTWLGRGLLVVTVALIVAVLLAPAEPVNLRVRFDPKALNGDVQAYFEEVEARFPDITPGVQKRVVWHGDVNMRTPYALVYIHGYSATSEEIRPVPDRVAKALQANLVFTRLTGHGRTGAAMADARVEDWMADVAEALAAARAVGDKVVVLSTSTGGSLMTAALLDPEMRAEVVASVFVSPNYGLNTSLEFLLRLPGARYWLPPIVGRERSFEAPSAAYETYWTTRYPSVAVLPMAALVKVVRDLPFEEIPVPALFVFSDNDQVVRPDLTRDFAARWGAGSDILLLNPGPDDDGYAHVIAGDIVSPGQTERAVSGILTWLEGKGIH